MGAKKLFFILIFLVVTILYIVLIARKPAHELTNNAAPVQSVGTDVDDQTPALGDVPASNELSAVSNKTSVLADPSAVQLEVIRSVLDKSMKDISSVYVGHQMLSSADSSQNVVSFVYRAEAAEMKTLAQLSQSIISAKEKQVEGKELMEAARNEGDHEKMLTAARLQVDGDRELYKEDSYTTIEISTTKDAPPVLMYQKGLPDWLVQSPHAEALASSRLSGPLVLMEITRHTLGGLLIFQYADSNGNEVYIDPRGDAIYSHREPVIVNQNNVRTQNATPDSDRANRIADQWNEFLEDGIDFQRFSLNDLEDLSQRR